MSLTTNATILTTTNGKLDYNQPMENGAEHPETGENSAGEPHADHARGEHALSENHYDHLDVMQIITITL